MSSSELRYTSEAGAITRSSSPALSYDLHCAAVNDIGQVPVVHLGVRGAGELDHHRIDVLVVFRDALVAGYPSLVFVLIDGRVDLLLAGIEQGSIVQGAEEQAHVLRRGHHADIVGLQIERIADMITAHHILHVHITDRSEGVFELKPVQDPFLDELKVRMVQHLVHDLGKQEVIGVAVGVAFARGEVGRQAEDQVELLRIASFRAGPIIGGIGIVGDPAAVLDQHPQGDPVGIFDPADQLGQIVRQRLVQGQPAILYQFGDGDRGVQLADAGDLEQRMRVRGYFILAAMPTGGKECRWPARLVHINDDPGKALVNGFLQLLLHGIGQR